MKTKVYPARRVMTASLFTLFGATYFLFLPIVEFSSRNRVDYANHLSYLKPDMDWPTIQRLVSMFPHFLFHLLTYLWYKLSRGTTIGDAGAGVTLAFYLLLALALFWLMVRLLGKPKNYGDGVIYVLISLGLMLVMPVDIFTPRNLYLGYIAIHVYHSPTMVVLKPFAIVLFYYAAQVFIRPTHPDSSSSNRRIIWLVALVTMLCILAKPNYVIVLLPALMLMTIYAYFRQQYVDWTLLTAILVGGGFILFCQAVVFGSTEGINIAALAVLDSWVSINPDAPKGLLLKFFLSIMFPLVIHIGYFKQAINNVYLKLAWITFVFGVVYFYLLAESGNRLDDGNFTWGAQIALLILFVASTVFFVQQIKLRKFSPTAAVCALAWGLHLVSGIYWYHIHIVAVSMGDIINSKW